MHALGNVLRIFTLPGSEDIIISDYEASSTDADRFEKGMALELRNKFSEHLPLTIEAAELASQMGKDYLAFVVQEKLDQQAVKAFDQVWTPVNLKEERPKTC